MLECAVVQIHELGLHTQFIGEIKDVKVDEDCIDETGHIDVARLGPVALALEGGGYFASAGAWARLSPWARRLSKQSATGREEKERHGV